MPAREEIGVAPWASLQPGRFGHRGRCSPYRRPPVAVLLLAALLPLASASVHAQTAPPAALANPLRQLEDEQRRQAQQQQELNRRLQEGGALLPRAVEAPSVTLLPALEAPCFQIRSVVYLDAPAYADAWLNEALSAPRRADGQTDDPRGRCLGPQGIAIVLQRVQNALIAQGYSTSRVFAPDQDLSKGALRLQVVLGRIGHIRLKPVDGAGAEAGLDSGAGALTAPHLVLGTTLPLRPGDALNLRDIEQGLDNLQRVYGATADFEIVPTPDEPNHSDILIRYTPGPRLRLGLNVNDAGGRTTGIYQGSASLSLNNLLGLADTFYVTVGNDLNQDLGQPLGVLPAGYRGTRNNSVHYSLPLGYWTVGYTANHSVYYQTVPGVNLDYLYSGESNDQALAFTRTIWRDARARLSVTAKAWQRDSRNWIEDTEVVVQRRVNGGWEAGLDFRLEQGSSLYTAGGSFRQGTGAFGTIASPEEASGMGTSYMRFYRFNAAALVPFNFEGEHWRYQAALNMQQHITPLPSPDWFSIGSRYTVRGFDGNASLVGDSGYTLRQDVGWLWGRQAQELYFALDTGEVSGPNAALNPGRALIGMALGQRGSVGALQYDVFVGVPVAAPRGFRTADFTSGFNLNYSF